MMMRTMPLLSFCVILLGSSLMCGEAHSAFTDSWIDPGRIMVVYNTTRMDSVDPAEPDSFSHDIALWYMQRYEMPTRHLFGYDMGAKVRWKDAGAFDFLQAIAEYIKRHDIQIVLLSPGTPMIVRDLNNRHNLALDSLAGHALWFADVIQEAPACRSQKSVGPDDSNLYFPYLDMGDGASPFVIRTNDASRWCPKGGPLLPVQRQWYDTMRMDLRNHPSFRPYGRIGLPYYLEAFPDEAPELQIPLENSQFVKDLVNGGFAATTSIKKFNAQSNRCLLFFGREGNTASFIDVESSITEAMAQEAIMKGVSEARIVRVKSGRGWNDGCCLKEPKWDFTADAFMNGSVSPKINPLIFSAGGVNNTKEDSAAWPSSLDVQPGLVASVSVSNGKTFAGSLHKRGATTTIVNIQHPQNSRLHAWFSVYRQLLSGATVTEAMVTSGGSERGGYVTGSIWGDPLYAPFGQNRVKTSWFTGRNLPAGVHPPVLRPIPDGISLEVPIELGNRKLAELGLLDVTAAPFHADATGIKDCTTELQQAIEFARDAQLVCFFPPGTYLIHDTLLLRHGIHMRSHRATLMNNRAMPCVLIGSRQGEHDTGYRRPKIVLAAKSPGFDDPDAIKYVIEHRQYDVRKFEVTKNSNGGGPSLMSTMFVNLDIEIRPGNPGAAGMHIRSCEGSAVQDVTIDATHGHTGIAGATGNGGSWANLTVIGGRIGIDMRGWTPPTPTMEGVTLIDQTEAAIVHACRGSLTAVGIKIHSKIPGPLIVGGKPWAPFDGSMNLIDSEIVFDRSTGGTEKRTAIASDKSVYLNNVFVRGADVIVAGSLAGDRADWVHVEEFSLGKTEPKQGYPLSAPIYVDGKKLNSVWKRTTPSVSPPADLQTQHVWDQTFPSWETEAAVNVKAAPYLAKGDSYADDTEALQHAIDENEIVFLPKGNYRLTKTLKLKSTTKLIGVAQHLSVIMARDPTTWWNDDGDPKPLVETADDGDADTMVAFLGIRFPLEIKKTFAGKTNPMYALRWQCGRRSIFRSNDIHPLRVFGFQGNKAYKIPALSHPSVVISNHGGGRWYNYHTTQFFTPTTPEQRAIRVVGTTEPLHFYNFEPQGGQGLAVAEFDQSQYISLYGCKTECDTTFLRVTDSDHVRIFGHGGIGNANAGGALYVIERTPNFLISNIADQVNLGKDRPYYSGHSTHRNIETYFPLLHRPETGPASRLPSVERPTLYRWGSPRPTP